MKEIEVAVMEPKYQINLGYIARVSKNFGIEKLILINPRCNYKGKEAIKYSKHAVSLLKNARVYKNIKDLDAGLIIGTTGIWHKTRDSFYNLYDLKSMKNLVRQVGNANRHVILLLGRDDTGLSKKELRSCDATVSIDTSGKYPILNISHALAILLYELKSSNYSKTRNHLYANASYQKSLFRLFEKLVKKNARIRDKDSVIMAFRHVIRRSSPTKKEINALSIAMSGH